MYSRDLAEFRNDKIMEMYPKDVTIWYRGRKTYVEVVRRVEKREEQEEKQTHKQIIKAPR